MSSCASVTSRDRSPRSLRSLRTPVTDSPREGLRWEPGRVEDPLRARNRRQGAGALRIGARPPTRAPANVEPRELGDLLACVGRIGQRRAQLLFAPSALREGPGGRMGSPRRAPPPLHHRHRTGDRQTERRPLRRGRHRSVAHESQSSVAAKASRMASVWSRGSEPATVLSCTMTRSWAGSTVITFPLIPTA